MTRRRIGIAALGCSVALALTACSNIPTSSAPQVVHAVDLGPAPANFSGAEPGMSERAIVNGFLDANAVPDANHSTARTYLAPNPKGNWQDAKALTVLDSITVGNPRNDKVVVEGREIGTVDNTQQAGVYTPALRGDGNGGALFRETFKLRRVHGQWRISSSLLNGLLVTQATFQTNYYQYGVYFIDSTGRHLVPELRYSE
ncbi:MAG TPA: hypothetical protein VGH30_01855, partial [Jatrophihabitantaceae bacterium]